MRRPAQAITIRVMYTHSKLAPRHLDQPSIHTHTHTHTQLCLAHTMSEIVLVEVQQVDSRQ